MSIGSEISRIQGNISGAYTAANAKGATMPVSQNSDNLASTIATIQTGVTPTGTISITSNGTHDVTNYATANVNVPSSAITKYNISNVGIFLGDLDANGILQRPTAPMGDLIFSGVKGFASYSATMGVLFRRFQNLETIKSVSFPDLETIDTAYAASNCFRDCNGLTSVDLSALTTVNATQAMSYMFYGCTSLTSVDLSALTTAHGDNVMQGMFYGCTSLTSVDLSALTDINSTGSLTDAFYNCTSLTSVDLSGITTSYGGRDSALLRTFYGCTSLRTVKLDSLETGKLSNTFYGCTSLTEINLPKLTSLTTFVECFHNCTNLTTVKMPLLERVSGGSGVAAYTFAGTGIVNIKFESLVGLSSGGQVMQNCFRDCPNLQNIYFYALTTSSFGSYTNTFVNMLYGDNNVVVHFPMNIQSTISSWSDVVNGFGGTNTTVLFDIVTILTLGSSDFAFREEAKSTSAATAWSHYSTIVYTSGTTEPVVGDNVYSDAECTQIIATIQAIA